MYSLHETAHNHTCTDVVHTCTDGVRPGYQYWGSLHEYQVSAAQNIEAVLSHVLRRLPNVNCFALTRELSPNYETELPKGLIRWYGKQAKLTRFSLQTKLPTMPDEIFLPDRERETDLQYTPLVTFQTLLSAIQKSGAPITSLAAAYLSTSHQVHSRDIWSGHIKMVKHAALDTTSFFFHPGPQLAAACSLFRNLRHLTLNLQSFTHLAIRRGPLSAMGPYNLPALLHAAEDLESLELRCGSTYGQLEPRDDLGWRLTLDGKFPFLRRLKRLTIDTVETPAQTLIQFIAPHCETLEEVVLFDIRGGQRVYEDEPARTLLDGEVFHSPCKKEWEELLNVLRSATLRDVRLVDVWGFEREKDGRETELQRLVRSYVLGEYEENPLVDLPLALNDLRYGYSSPNGILNAPHYGVYTLGRTEGIAVISSRLI